MEPITTILVSPTAERKTAPSGFGAALRSAAAGAADGLAAAAGLAGPLAPVGMVLAGAVRGAALSASSPRPGAAQPAAGGASGGDAFEAARLLQQEGQSFNLRYLELQERMQRETREFTAVSNVMKVRHDAARTAIQNVQ
jgi:hypothetical protein